MYVNFSKRPDTQAVLHCHPPHLNAFAISDSKKLSHASRFQRQSLKPVWHRGAAWRTTDSEIGDNFFSFPQKYNGFPMENHGYVFLTPWDIKWAQMCTDLLEMTVSAHYSCT